MMTNKKLYTFEEVTSATYYDVIEMMGDDGLNAKLTAYDLLAVMAAPCTRLDYENTDPSRRTPLMIAVHAFMMSNNRITNLTHRELVAVLNRSFLPSLQDEQQKKLLTSFRMVMGFDADGYAIFDKKYFDVYKGNMSRGQYTKIVYGAISNGSPRSMGLPDKEITKVYQTKLDNGLYHLDLDLTVEDWRDILRGSSPKSIQLLKAFSLAEQQTATHTEIEEKYGILSDTINGITAGLGNRAKRIMGIEVLGHDGNPSCWILPFNNGRNEFGRGFVWELRPEVCDALKLLTMS